MLSRRIRFLNWVIDSVISITVFIVLVRLLFPDGISREYATLIDLLIIVFNFAYYLIFESIIGRTPAKFFTRTIVLDEENNPASFKKILIRTFSRFVPLEPLFILFNEDKMGLHDVLSATKTINLNNNQNY